MRSLGARLDTCLSLINGERCITDVGTDHGRLPVYALKQGRTERAVAVDISEKSLKKATFLAEKEGVALTAVVCDGLQGVEKEDASLVIIAGMGGREIVKIVEEAPFPLERAIFVPHTHAALLRGYVRERNARIERDIVVEEGEHYYPVILVDFRLPWREEDNVYVGREGEARDAYIEMRLKKIEEYLAYTDDAALKEEKEILESVYRS